MMGKYPNKPGKLVFTEVLLEVLEAFRQDYLRNALKPGNGRTKDLGINEVVLYVVGEEPSAVFVDALY